VRSFELGRYFQFENGFGELFSVVQRFVPLASTDRDYLHMLARPCDRHPGALAKPARQRLKILLARPLRSYALAAVLKHAHRGPPITDGVGGSGNGHGRINASPAALIRAPCATQAFTVIRADATLCRRPHIDTRRWTSPMTASAGCGQSAASAAYPAGFTADELAVRLGESILTVRPRSWRNGVDRNACGVSGADAVTVVGGRKVNATGRSTGKLITKRRHKIAGQFGYRLIEMLESPAHRVLSLSARRLLDRIEIEHAHHGGQHNGRLPVTFNQFVEYGIERHAIAPAMRECVALGFLVITEEGRAGNREFARPNLFRLTFRHTALEQPTEDWRKIETIEDAEAIAQRARASPPKKQKTSGGKPTGTVGETKPTLASRVSSGGNPHYYLYVQGESQQP